MRKMKEQGRRAMCKLLIVSLVCFFFMGFEIAGGTISGSLAIMTDAAHMFSDVAGFMISYFAIYMSNKPASFNMSFGYHRAEVLGAIASILFIWGLLIWLLIEAVQRVIHGSEIDGFIMLITASVGLVCNLVNIFVLDRVGESRDVIETMKGSEIS
jgi:zinc transporter 2